MANNHATSNGVSRSNAYRSQDGSQDQRRHARQFHAGEGTSGHTMEERVRKMEETQNEILRLLLETRKPMSAQQEKAHTPHNQFQTTGVPLEHTHKEPQHHQAHAPQHDDDLIDTGSSTHLSHIAKSAQKLPTVENSILPQVVDTPRHVLHNELRRLIHEEFSSKDKSHARRSFQESSPLAETVLQHPIPTSFKLPSVDPYDGTSDPYEHVDHFKTIMRIQRAPDALLCQVFPVTLKEQARTWFYSLSGGIIHTFDELARLFVEQFIANRRIIKDSSHLSGIRQNEGESLKEYFHRFSYEARQIPGVNPELLRGVFLGGLRPGPFYSSLMRDTVRTYATLIHRVEAQISAEEAIGAHKKQFEQSTPKHKNDAEITNQQSQRRKFEHKGSHNLPPGSSLQQRKPQLEKYTPLNTSRTNVLMAIHDKETQKQPTVPVKNHTEKPLVQIEQGAERQMVGEIE